MSVINRIFQNVRVTVRKFRPVIIGVLIFLLIAIVAWSYFKAQRTDDNTTRIPLSSLQTPEGTPTATVFPPPGWATPGAYTPSAGTPQATINFVDGSQWKVIKNDEEAVETVKISGRTYTFTYAIVTFQNLTDGSSIKGHCQQPKWPLPAVGDIYTLKNTSNNYWLFIPNMGEEGDFQYFKPMN